MVTRQRLTAVGLAVLALLLGAGWAYTIKHVGHAANNNVAISAPTTTDTAALPNASTEPSAVRPSSVYVLGDDLVASAVRGPGRSAADVALFRLGVAGTVSGQAGSGFLPGLDAKAQTYSYRLASDVAGRPVKLLVIVAGSGDRNAGAMSLRAAVDLTLHAARQAVPGANVLLVGPLGSPTLGSKRRWRASERSFGLWRRTRVA